MVYKFGKTTKAQNTINNKKIHIIIIAADCPKNETIGLTGFSKCFILNGVFPVIATYPNRYEAKAIGMALKTKKKLSDLNA
jgi:hypothetical protein